MASYCVHVFLELPSNFGATVPLPWTCIVSRWCLTSAKLSKNMESNFRTKQKAGINSDNNAIIIATISTYNGVIQYTRNAWKITNFATHHLIVYFYRFYLELRVKLNLFSLTDSSTWSGLVRSLEYCSWFRLCWIDCCRLRNCANFFHHLRCVGLMKSWQRFPNDSLPNNNLFVFAKKKWK